MDSWITKNVLVDIERIIDTDFEGFLDLLSQKVIGDELLMDIQYKLIGITNENLLVIEVQGDASNSWEAQ